MLKAHASESNRELSLSRHIMAPKEKVYQAWTNPEQLIQWFTPAPWTTRHAELDVRPGGINRVTMCDPEGKEFPHPGVYLEVVPDEKLVITDAYVSAWEPSGKPFTTICLSFREEAGGSRYEARVLHWFEEDRLAHEQMGFDSGWAKATDQMEDLLGRGREILTQRLLPFSPAEVYEAFRNPELLEKWWGPDGFTNRFRQFDLKPGGEWIFSMFGPDGKEYPNESRFLVVEPDRCIVFEHVCEPQFRMKMTLREEDGKTRLIWRMQFENESKCESVKTYSPDCNEQNFDRLEAVLAGTEVKES